jgi:hypothetical protein
VVLMAADPLDQVLRLVAEGRLTAEEAAPILAALDEAGDARAEADAALRQGAEAEAAGHPGFGEFEAEEAGPGFGAGRGTAPSTLRLEVREHGRSVVNLRLPVALGRLAIDRVPGLSGDQVDRVREALRSGLRGPVLTVDDGDSGVRIVLE